MQTFLPYASFDDSATCLDRARLGKQRVETLQILQSLDRFQNQNLEKSGWINHPATQMWMGYERSLIRYGKVICIEWMARGYKDTCYEKIGIFTNLFTGNDDDPWWLGRNELHISHQAMLYGKAPDYYAHFASSSAGVTDYWWPSRHAPSQPL
jgi:hypothetical protein